MAGAWYDTNKITVNTGDTDKITTNGAAAVKGISEAFNGFGKILEDRTKQEKADKEAELKRQNDEADRKIKMETLYDQREDRADTKQKAVEQAAQDEINNEVFKEMVKYKTKEEFNANVNPDLIKYADGKTVVATETFYNKSEQEQAALKQAAADAENKIKLAEMGLKLQEQKVKTESAKGKSESSDNRSVKAADDSLISKGINQFFDGEYGLNGEYTLADENTKPIAAQLAADASEIFKMNKNITHNQAVNLAYKNYLKSNPISTPASTESEDSKEGKITNTSIVTNDNVKVNGLADALQPTTKSDNLKRLEAIKNMTLK